MTIDKLYILFLAQGQRITTDSRTINKGEIFFALKGDNFDGNKYALQALEQGAKYAVVDDKKLRDNKGIILVDDVLNTLQELALYHRRRLNISIIAITGSNGKTTSKELIKDVLAKRFKVAATKGNLNNHIGIPLTLLDIKAYDDISIVEMGANHQGEIESYCQYVEPNFGLITNIGKAHLEGFGSVEGILKGKTELYEYIKEHKGKIFLNVDDKLLSKKAEYIAHIPYGTNKEIQIHGEIDKNSKSDYLSILVNDNDTMTIQTKLTGDYNLYNVLSAYTIGRYFEIDKTKIIQAIEEYSPSNNRSQIIKRDNATIIMDAYNANPSSMEEALHNLSKFQTKKIAILGSMKEMGKYSEEEHEKVIQLCIFLDLDKTALVGTEFMTFKAKYKGIEYFKDVNTAKEWFDSQDFNDATILLKGSRAVQLENILEKSSNG